MTWHAACPASSAKRPSRTCATPHIVATHPPPAIRLATHAQTRTMTINRKKLPVGGKNYAGSRSSTAELWPLVHSGADIPHVPHHLSRPRQHLDGCARDQQGIRLRQDHHGHHLQCLCVGLCHLSGSGRLAQRPVRRPAGPGGDRRLLVGHDRGDRDGDRVALVLHHSLSVRGRRSRRLSGRHPRNAGLVPAAGARPGAGAHPRSAGDRCSTSAARPDSSGRCGGT